MLDTTPHPTGHGQHPTCHAEPTPTCGCPEVKAAAIGRQAAVDLLRGWTAQGGVGHTEGCAIRRPLFLLQSAATVLGMEQPDTGAWWGYAARDLALRMLGARDGVAVLDRVKGRTTTTVSLYDRDGATDRTLQRVAGYDRRRDYGATVQRWDFGAVTVTIHHD